MWSLNRDDYFILFSNCIPVKGAVRSLICDVQNGKYYYIPNDLFDILIRTKLEKLFDIYQSFTKDDKPILDEYFNYLEFHGLGFFDSSRMGLTELSHEWDLPCEISNSILDIDQDLMANISYKKVCEELQLLNCVCLEIRSFKEIELGKLESILDLTLDSRFRELRLVLHYSHETEQRFKQELIKKHKRITQVILFNSEDNHTENVLGVQFHYIKERLNENACGNICRSAFSPTIEHFTESLKFNSCLNRKISLDSAGNIKNCPSQKESYGNIMSSSFKEVIKNEHFKSLWKIKKDDIEVCKECEYRYICTDCRVFVQNDKFSKPSKCNYDPYTATWN